MDQENKTNPNRIIIASAIIIIVILALAVPREETFDCEICRDEVTQVPNMAHSLPGYEGATFKWLYNLEYHDKLCDDCYEELETQLKNK